MATTKTRINISVPKELEQVINLLAKRDAVPVATKARQLIESSLVLEENSLLAKLVKDREREGTFISHHEAWKRFTR